MVQPVHSSGNWKLRNLSISLYVHGTELTVFAGDLKD